MSHERQTGNVQKDRKQAPFLLERHEFEHFQTVLQGNLETLQRAGKLSPNSRVLYIEGEPNTHERYVNGQKQKVSQQIIYLSVVDGKYFLVYPYENSSEFQTLASQSATAEEPKGFKSVDFELHLTSLKTQHGYQPESATLQLYDPNNKKRITLSFDQLPATPEARDEYLLFVFQRGLTSPTIHAPK